MFPGDIRPEPAVYSLFQYDSHADVQTGACVLKAGEFRKRLMDTAKTAVQKGTFAVLSFFGIPVRKLSLRQTRRLAFLIGDFLHRIIGLRRSLVYRNLSLTFPDKSAAEIRRIARDVYRNLASTLFEVLRLPLVRSREDAAALVDIDGSGFLHRTRDRQSGAVIVSAHYGNWELMAMAFGLLVHPVTIIVKRLHNRPIDQQINEYRTMMGNSVVDQSQSLRHGLRLLQNGGMLAILGDQSDPDAANYGEFLGRRASIFHGPAFFALKANVPLFVTICHSNGDGRYTIDIREVETSDLSFSKDDIATLASRYTSVLEEEILRRPEEWFWLHDRWKRSDREPAS